jgi:hypothetical protein
MRKFLLVLLLLPFIAWSQNKNVVNTTRVFPKVDKVPEFEKAIAAHAQKYHTGDWKWRVFEIQTGPDVGGYHITEGPATWDMIDGRGNLGTEHNNDWNKTIAPLLTQELQSSYSVYNEELSTVAIGDYSDKIIITHYYQKLGYGGDLRALLAKMKKAWEAGGSTVAVYTSAASGAPQFAVVNRLKQGLKEMNSGFRTPIKERYEKANGPDSYDEWIDFMKHHIEKSWSEMLYFRADLSSR